MEEFFRKKREDKLKGAQSESDLKRQMNKIEQVPSDAILRLLWSLWTGPALRCTWKYQQYVCYIMYYWSLGVNVYFF